MIKKGAVPFNPSVNFIDPWGLCKEKAWWKNYIDFSFNYSVFGRGEVLSEEGWQTTKTFYDLIGVSFDINVGWLPSLRDLVTEIGVGVGDYLGLSYFFGRPNAAGDFQVGGLSFHIGIGVGTPAYVSATYPSETPKRNIITRNLYYERQRR